MKRIEFLAPVEAMRGNLSGSQILTYEGGKKAWDAEDNGAAENYDNRYIGAKRIKNGKKFFSLKTKSTTSLGANSRLAMAAFGGACSLAKAAGSVLAILTDLQDIYLSKKQMGLIPANIGFRNWLQTCVYPMLKGKTSSVTITDGVHSVTINNPWIEGGSGTAVTVPADIKTKFNAQLSA